MKKFDVEGFGIVGRSNSIFTIFLIEVDRNFLDQMKVGDIQTFYFKSGMGTSSAKVERIN